MGNARKGGVSDDGNFSGFLFRTAADVDLVWVRFGYGLAHGISGLIWWSPGGAASKSLATGMSNRGELE